MALRLLSHTHLSLGCRVGLRVLRVDDNGKGAVCSTVSAAEHCQARMHIPGGLGVSEASQTEILSKMLRSSSSTSVALHCERGMHKAHTVPATW